MTAELMPVDQEAAKVQVLIELVVNGLNSPHSRRAYERALTDFLAWYADEGRPGLSKATVQRYQRKLVNDGLSSSSVNLRLSAIRKMAKEAADNAVIDQALANGIGKVKGVKQAGVRSGNWLDQRKAQRLLDAPDTATLKGLRDRAILALMLGCGLRRSEVAALDYRRVVQRDGRFVICDLVGKGNRLRTVPIPTFAKAALDVWSAAVSAADGYLDPPMTGRVFRSLRRGGHLDGNGMTDQAIADVVRTYGAELGEKLAAHDLRRTYAKLAHKADGRLDQIQITLGHASLKTTERYLGIEQDLQDAPGDHIRLRIH